MTKLKYVCGTCFTTNAVPQNAAGKKVVCGRCKANLLDPHPVVLNEASFNKFIAENELPVVVDFWAPWCGPCRMMAPVFEQTAQNFLMRARFAKLDTQDNPGIAAAYGITGIPTIIVYKNGQISNRISGAMDATTLTRWLNQNGI